MGIGQSSDHPKPRVIWWVMPASWVSSMLDDYMLGFASVSSELRQLRYGSQDELRRELHASGITSTTKLTDLVLIIPQDAPIDGGVSSVAYLKHHPGVFVFNVEQMTRPNTRLQLTWMVTNGWKVVDYSPGNACILAHVLVQKHRARTHRILEDVWVGSDSTLVRAEQALKPTCTSTSVARHSAAAAILSRSESKECILSTQPSLTVVPYQRTEETDWLNFLVTSENKTSDVVFSGVGSSPRQAVVDALRAEGIVVSWGWAFGKERDLTIARAKVVLNMHYAINYNIFESIRCDRWLMAGHVVVSAPSITLTPYDLETPTLVWATSSAPDDMVRAVKNALARWDELHAAGLAFARAPSRAVQRRAGLLQGLLDGVDEAASRVQQQQHPEEERFE